LLRRGFPWALRTLKEYWPRHEPPARFVAAQTALQPALGCLCSPCGRPSLRGTTLARPPPRGGHGRRDLDPVLASALGRVEGGIGGREQAAHVARSVGQGGHSDAGRDPEGTGAVDPRDPLRL